MVKLTKAELARYTIDEVVANLDSGSDYSLGDLVKQYGEDALLYGEVEYGYYDDVSVVLKLHKVREETDEEYNNRIDRITYLKQRELERNKLAKASATEREYAQFLRLKKKFEKTS